MYPSSPWRLMIDPSTQQRFWFNQQTGDWDWAEEVGPSGSRSSQPAAPSTSRPRTTGANPVGSDSAWRNPTFPTSPGRSGNYSWVMGAHNPSSTITRDTTLIGSMGHMHLNHPRYTTPGYGQVQPNPGPWIGGSTSANGKAPLSRPERHIRGTPGVEEPLDPNFRRREEPHKWFKEGKVFLTLWSEPASSGSVGSDVTPGIHGQNVHSKIRRFVIIRANNGSCSCLQIVTYGGRGLAKPGAQKADHAVIYTGDQPPSLLPGEAPRRGERAMLPFSFKVTPYIKGEKLDPISRINFGKIYTVEHTLKVRGFGMVDKVDQLKNTHTLVWYREPTLPPPQSLSGIAGIDVPHGSGTSRGALTTERQTAESSYRSGSASRYQESYAPLQEEDEQQEDDRDLSSDKE